MPVLDEKRSINEPHATTFHPGAPQAGGPDRTADTTVIFFDADDTFDIFDTDDIDDTDAVEEAESAYQDASRKQRASAIRIIEAVARKADESIASGAGFLRRLH